MIGANTLYLWILGIARPQVKPPEDPKVDTLIVDKLFI